MHGHGQAPQTISVAEIRRKLDQAKIPSSGSDRAALDQAIDNMLAALRAKYGDQVPALEAARFLRNLPLPAAAQPQPPPQAPENPPDGVRVLWTPAGFLLRVSCRSLVAAALWFGFAGLLLAIPFRIWDDLIREVWTDGFRLSFASLFLAAWGIVALCVAGMGLASLIGEIRIAKSGDYGEVVKRVAGIGWTYRFHWADFYEAADRDVATPSANGRFDHISYYVGLNGHSKKYRFGSELNAPQRAFLIAFLNKHAFISGGRPR